MRSLRREFRQTTQAAPIPMTITVSPHLIRAGYLKPPCGVLHICTPLFTWWFPATHCCPAAATAAQDVSQSHYLPSIHLWALLLWSPAGVCYSFPLMSVKQIICLGMDKLWQSLTPNLLQSCKNDYALLQLCKNAQYEYWTQFGIADWSLFCA